MSIDYVNGVISAREKRLLTKDELKTLSNISKDKLVKELHQMGYGPKFRDVETIEEILDYELEEVDDLIKPLKELDNLRIVVFYDNLLTSLTSLYKHKYFNLSLSKDYNPLISFDVLYDAVVNGLVSRLDKFYLNLIEIINSNVKNVSSLVDLNNLIVKLSYEYLYDYLVNNRKNKGLLDYVAYKIDLMNLNYSLLINDRKEVEEKALILRGDLYKIVLDSKDNEDLIINRLSLYDNLMREEMSEIFYKSSYYELPNVTNEFLKRKIRTYRYDLTSQNHILYYIEAIKQQAKALKEIYYGVYDGL